MISTRSIDRAFKLAFALLLGLSLVDKQAQADDEPTPITVTEVISEDVTPSVPAAGTVYSRNEAQITAGMAGRLEWLAEAQPDMFVEMSEELAQERGIANGEKVKIRSARGEIQAV